MKSAKLSQELRKRLSQNLTRLRSAQGLSRAGLAARAAVHLRHLEKIEAGEVNVTIDTITRLARGLGVDSHELLAKAPKGRRPREPR